MNHQTTSQPDATPAPTRAMTQRLQFRLWSALGLLVSVLGIGTVGYALLEGWPLLDALYMTVITMTTVGYAETRQRAGRGAARLVPGLSDRPYRS